MVWWGYPRARRTRHALSAAACALVLLAAVTAAGLAPAHAVAAGAAGPAAVSPATARAAAKASKDLGPADYDGYCKHLGFVRSQITPSKDWACLHADGTTSPLDLQAACEFTYTQRPIAAAQITPGVPFTWQCWAAAPGKVVLPGNGGAGASSPLAAAVLRALVPHGRAAKIATLLRRGRYATSFSAPRLGRLTLGWYYKPAGRHARSTLVAGASALFSRASTRPVAIVLTKKGKRLLKHASRLRISARGSYVANASNPVGASTTFTLRR